MEDNTEEVMNEAREVAEALLAHEEDLVASRDALPEGMARNHFNNILTVIRASSIILGQVSTPAPIIPPIEE